MVYSISEILSKISKFKKTQDKVQYLKENDTFAMRVILQAIYDPNVKFLLPPGVPPYKPNEFHDTHHILKKEARKIRYFIEGFYPNLRQIKREQMFIELLESVHPEDAKLLCDTKDKKVIKGLNRTHIKEALPGLLTDVEN